MVGFSVCNTFIYKIRKLRYVFHILQHFATKLGNFTYSKMFFRAVIKYFVGSCLDQNLVCNANCPIIDHSPFKLNLHFCKKIKIARKSMLKLVKLPSLVAKYCKTWKIYACKVCKFCILLYYAYHKMAELPVNFGHFVVSVIQKCTKFENFASVYFLYFTTFRHQTWQFY